MAVVADPEAGDLHQQGATGNLDHSPEWFRSSKQRGNPGRALVAHRPDLDTSAIAGVPEKRNDRVRGKVDIFVMLIGLEDSCVLWQKYGPQIRRNSIELPGGQTVENPIQEV